MNEQQADKMIKLLEVIANNSTTSLRDSEEKRFLAKMSNNIYNINTTLNAMNTTFQSITSPYGLPKPLV